MAMATSTLVLSSGESIAGTSLTFAEGKFYITGNAGDLQVRTNRGEFVATSTTAGYVSADHVVSLVLT